MAVYKITWREYSILQKLTIRGTELESIVENAYIERPIDGIDNNENPFVFIQAKRTQVDSIARELVGPWNRLLTQCQDDKWISMYYDVKRLNPQIIIPTILHDRHRITDRENESTLELPSMYYDAEMLSHFNITDRW